MSHWAADTDHGEPAGQPLAAPPTPTVLRYVHARTFSFALVLFDDASPPSVRLVVCSFADAPSAEQFAVSHGYSRYLIAPATPVLAVLATRP